MESSPVELKPCPTCGKPHATDSVMLDIPGKTVTLDLMGKHGVFDWGEEMGDWLQRRWAAPTRVNKINFTINDVRLYVERPDDRPEDVFNIIDVLEPPGVRERWLKHVALSWLKHVAAGAGPDPEEKE